MARTAMITERDRELLAFLAEQRVATTRQLARLLEVAEPTAVTRIERLHGSGLLRCERIFSGQAPAVFIRSRGLAALERRLPEPRQNLQTYRHDVTVTEIALDARAGAYGDLAAIVSEREMRSHDGRAGNELDADKYGVALWRGDWPGSQRGPGSDRHYPDLMLQTPKGKQIAVEVELTAKSQPRLRDILSSYAIDGRYARVMYYIPSKRLGDRIQAAARWAGAEQLVAARLIDPAPRPGVPARRVTRGLPMRQTPVAAR